MVSVEDTRRLGPLRWCSATYILRYQYVGVYRCTDNKKRKYIERF